MKEGEEDDTDFRSGHKFADHMQGKTTAVSDFAIKKSMLQQRQYLPVFAVREEVGFILNFLLLMYFRAIHYFQHFHENTNYTAEELTADALFLYIINDIMLFFLPLIFFFFFTLIYSYIRKMS